MKRNTFILTSLALLIITSATRTHLKQAEVVQYSQLEHVNTKIPHISEVMNGNPQNLPKDPHPLWRNAKDNNMERPFYNGVVGRQWTPPLADSSNGFNILASPHPTSDPPRRVVANELPAPTYSKTSFDLPKRNNVVQIDLPPSTIKTVEAHYDPRVPAKVPVATVSGTLIHGTGSTNEKIVNPSFLEVGLTKNNYNNYNNNNNNNAKSNTNSNSIANGDKVQTLRNEGAEAASSAFKRADANLGLITRQVDNSGHMILDVNVVNKLEDPKLGLHEISEERHKEINSKFDGTLAGVKLNNGH